jgi:hypothetical protein
MFKGGLELEAAAAHIAEVPAEKADGRVVRHGVARFVDLLRMNEDAAGEDQRLGALACGDEAAFHQ